MSEQFHGDPATPTNEFNVGQTVRFKDRSYVIEKIEGSEAEIFAPESSHEITRIERLGEHSLEDVAHEHGGILKGEPHMTTSPDGIQFETDTIIFPEDRITVKLDELISE